jgi:ATP-dependent protease HslVU (ClpYQ) peptidase subunit
MAGHHAGETDTVTCIIGMKDRNGDVWIGGDSAGVAGYQITIRSDEKVFRKGPMVFGFTSSFRMGQLLHYSLEIPEHPKKKSDAEFMASDFVNAVRRCFKEGGFASVVNGSESGGSFIVGYHGELYCVEGDFQVGIPSNGMCAVGCGEDLAMGALYANKHLKCSRKRIRNALMAASEFSAGVAPPFTIIKLPRV